MVYCHGWTDRKPYQHSMKCNEKTLNNKNWD